MITTSSGSTTSWFGSDARMNHCASIEAIPAIKRFVLCWLNYRKWKQARALDNSAIYALKALDDGDLFDKLLRISDSIWADIYELDPTP